ncbi:MAG: hypothetical protein JXB39_14795 [Deltaproteobacteria bacterium]|nr:hypothetical protein [Deltaproteobacteria bacterium]
MNARFWFLLPCTAMLGVPACTKTSDTDPHADELGTYGPLDDDYDSDGILNAVEGDEDFDGDGIPNDHDTDSDNDCILDKVERGNVAVDAAPVNSDGDSLPDFLDVDSDNNGLLDAEEAVTCPSPKDRDQDGVGDYADLDDDADHILDTEEGVQDPDSDGTGNYQDDDSDGDCIRDVDEAGDANLATHPYDTDGDTVPDYLDTDSDGDGMSDTEEVEGACDPVGDFDHDGSHDNIDEDIDGDGLSNVDEYTRRTDPRDRDTDGDGATDGLEVYAETNPREVANAPHGTIIATGPRQHMESDGVYTVDRFKVDVFVLLDTAYSYSCYHPTLPDFIDALVKAVFGRFDDVAVGFALYDDYNYASGWAATGGYPFRIWYQISTNETAIKRAAETASMQYGGDSYGSGYEALYQTVTGLGWDQESDGSFDSDTDIKPFMAHSADAFQGSVEGSYDASIVGSGTGAGVGWRNGSSKVIILGSDNVIRDGDMGHAVPEGCRFDPATFTTATEAVVEARAHVIGVNVYEYQTSDHTLQTQLTAIAVATDSYIDEDDDGLIDEPAVLYGSWNWPDINQIIDAIWDLAGRTSIDLWLEIGEDERHWVTSVSPMKVIPNLEQGDTIPFTVETRTSAPTIADDQFYHATIKVMEEDGEFGDHDLWLVIRPETQI